MLETSMTSGSNESPPPSARPDLILLALFQSRLRERSQYLGRVIQSQRKRISNTGEPPAVDDDADDEAPLDRIRMAEQALAAVQEAERRLGRGRYGICDSCNEPIAWDELLQSPEQTSCRSCNQFGGLDEDRLKN
jgi:RNA polymerase-binding transcription factor DksA